MRFRQRHVSRTIVEFLKAELTAAGWVEEPANFGASPLRFQEDVTVHDAPADLEGNLMGITIEDEGPDEHEQLGGGLMSVRYSLFIDVHGQSVNHAKRIMSDVKEILRDRVIRVVDFSGSTPVQSDDVLEFEVVAIEVPPRGPAGEMEARRKWRVLTAFAICTFPEYDEPAAPEGLMDDPNVSMDDPSVMMDGVS